MKKYINILLVVMLFASIPIGMAQTQASRDIENQSLPPGGSTIINITILNDVSQAISSMETLPSGWTMLRIKELPVNASSFRASTHEWVWFTVGAGDKLNVVYQLNVPLNAVPGIYNISGIIQNSSAKIADVAGENTITVAPVNVSFTLTLTPTTAQNIVGQQHTVTANVTNSTGAPKDGVLVNFSVISGPNSGLNGSNATDTTGKAKFTYTGSNGIGVDQIKACFTGQNNAQVCSQVVTKEWINQTINQTINRPTEIIDNMTGIPVVNESTVNILAEDFMNFTLGDQYNITITRVSDGVVEFNTSGTLMGLTKETIKVNWIPKGKVAYILRSEANTTADAKIVQVINQKVISPVPELSTIVLLSAGLIGLFGLARRRNN